MKADIGDRIAVPGRRVGDPNREGEVIAVRGQDGSAPYLVRWDDGHEGLLYPGAGTQIQPATTT